MAIPARQQRLRGTHAFVDGISFTMPVQSRDSSAIIAAFPIDWDKAAALIPPGDVHPFRLWKRGVLLVTVVDYRLTDIGAYIEYSLAIACTKGARPAPPLLPAVLMSLFGSGQYVFDLPVSTEISVKGGKGIWGMPKHQANLDFLTGSQWVSSQYDLDGQMVSRFDVRKPSSYWLPLNMGATNYCVFRDMMMKSVIYFQGKAGVHLLRSDAARLRLGDHPRAQIIRDLDVDPKPIFAAHIPSVLGLLDDFFECWFVTPGQAPATPFSEGLEATYPLGYGRDWLPPPNRDPNFDLDKA
ncbi:acetoacetate decarboxylase family protein [Acidisoma cellulosilytica]|uniref:Acetoacetate decarboxylase family protein n=1 Tax=Acidisoma cellulosilyticum TaxID=2802395 RepID=A0A963Z564_9PROT|nr:acetoacetate decarboxylase family protein [Acidisoma cellulosilyticum]MCB8883075.1 acetoacetate decarboxylase family protein [Acidisoma cellulosilyticum]